MCFDVANGMQPALKPLRLIAGAVTAILLFSALPALAQHTHGAQPATTTAKVYKVGSLTIMTPWSRATASGAPVAAGFLRVTNEGATDDHLIAAEFEGAGLAEVHETTEEGGVARMHKLDAGILVPAGKTVELKPGGYHLMFMKLQHGLAAGEERKATLIFEKAGKVDVVFTVMGIGAGADSHEAHKTN